jgi:hypothetical protein
VIFSIKTNLRENAVFRMFPQVCFSVVFASNPHKFQAQTKKANALWRSPFFLEKAQMTRIASAQV